MSYGSDSSDSAPVRRPPPSFLSSLLTPQSSFLNPQSFPRSPSPSTGEGRSEGAVPLLTPHSFPAINSVSRLCSSVFIRGFLFGVLPLPKLTKIAEGSSLRLGEQKLSATLPPGSILPAAVPILFLGPSWRPSCLQSWPALSSPFLASLSSLLAPVPLLSGPRPSILAPQSSPFRPDSPRIHHTGR